MQHANKDAMYMYRKRVHTLGFPDVLECRQ